MPDDTTTFSDNPRTRRTSAASAASAAEQVRAVDTALADFGTQGIKAA